jgi:outer membrane protein TolC
MRSADYLVKGQTPEMNLPVYDGDAANLEGATQFAYIPSISIAALDYLNMVSIMAVQPVYAGGQIANGNKLATLGVTIRRQQQSMTETDVLVRTEELYWNTVALYEKRRTIASYQQMLDSLARDVKNATDAGLVHRSDLLKVQLQQTDLRNGRMKLDNGIFLSKLALCQHIGIPADRAGKLELETLPMGATVLLGELENGNVKDRHEYIVLDKLVEVNKLEKSMAVGANLPQLSIGASAFSQDVMDVTSSNAFVFATLSIPISDWWGGSHKIKEKELRLQIAQHKLAETAELMNVQMQQAKQQVEESYWEVEFAKEGEAQASEHLKVVTDNHGAGVVPTSDLLEARAMYQQSLDKLTDAQCRRQIAKAKYKQAMGQ